MLCFRHSHEQDADTAYRYTLDFAVNTRRADTSPLKSFKEEWWRKKPYNSPFLQRLRGRVYPAYYSSAPSLVATATV
jgi:hypothetical protein